jgi:ParB-like chromosome segregation protein Spo0J
VKIVKKKVKDLKLAPYNPRYMPEEEKERLKKSLEAFGYVDPIIWNKRTGHVVGGNQRLVVLQELGVEEVDVVVVDLPLEKEKALNIALNQISGEWDFAKLADILNELDDELRDLTGWTPEEIEDIIATNIVMPEEWNEDDEEEEKEITEDDLTDEQKQHMKEAWQQVGKELLEDYEKLQHPMLLSRGVVKLWFLQALYLGKKMPVHWHWAYHPHLIETPGASHSIKYMLEKVAEGDESYIRGLSFVTSGGKNLQAVFRATLPVAGSRVPGNFPPEVAKALCNEFAPGGKVLNPTHGWGGQFVGFLLSKAKFYTGNDVSPLTSAGVKRIAEDLLPYVPDKEAEFFNLPFEEMEVREDFYDLVYCSPPYFNVERYLGGKQSHSEYDNYKAWRDGFYTILIEKGYKALRPGGVFALQVGSQRYPLKDDGIEIAKQVGFKVREIRHTGMFNNFTGTSPEKGEVILVLQKPE